MEQGDFCEYVYYGSSWFKENWTCLQWLGEYSYGHDSAAKAEHGLAKYESGSQ